MAIKLDLNSKSYSLGRSAMGCSSVVFVHPSPLFAKVIASLLKAPFRLACIVSDVDCVPFEVLRESEATIFMVRGRTNQPTSKVIRSIRERLPSAIIIVIGDTNEPRVALNALEAGANGYLREAVTLQTLMITLALALAGYLRGHPAALQQSSIIDADLRLTERELVILKGLANGLPNKVIAKSLAITEATVKVHVKTVFRKIRAKNRTQAAVWALKNINGSSIEH